MKKIFAPLSAVAMVAVMAVSLLSQTGQVRAATLTVAASTTVALTTNAANGTGAYTALAGNIVLTTGAGAGDVPVGTLFFDAPTGWQFNTAIAADVVSSSPPANAAQTLTFTAGTLVAGESVTINGITYTFQLAPSGTATATACQVQLAVAGTATNIWTASMQNLASTINNGASASINNGCAASNSSGVVATVPSATTLTVTAKIPGTAANAIATTSADGDSAWGAAALAGGTAGNFAASPTVTYSGDSRMIVTVTVANDANVRTLTIGGVTKPQIRPISGSSLAGIITYVTGGTSVPVVAIATGTSVAPIVLGTAMPTTGAIALLPNLTSISTNGTEVTAIVATLTATGGTIATNTAITCSTGLGRIASTTTGALSSTATSVTVATGSAGTASFFLRSGGTVGTDTVVCSAPALAAVQTTNISMVAGTGNTATKSVLLSNVSGSVGATNTLVGTQYIATTASSLMTLLAQDANSAGVNGQVLLISTNKGALVLGAGACAGVTAKAVPVTTATIGTNAGAAQVTYCALSTPATELGTATITVKNVSTTTVADVTASITAAGAPAAVVGTVANNVITVEVKDAAGNFVADGTPVTFAIAANSGVVSSACTLSSGGKATSTVALTGASGNVVVAASFNETGAAPTCTATGAKQIATTIAVGAGGTVTPPTPGAAGTFSGGTIAPAGVSIVSFTGTTVQLDTAGNAANPKIVSVSATVGGKLITFVIGAPAFVNAEFNAAFPTGLSATLVIVKTGA